MGVKARYDRSSRQSTKNHGVGIRALKAPLLTTLFGPVPEFGVRVKANVPVVLVAVSVEIVTEPLPDGPAASQPTVGDVTSAPVTGLLAPTLCVPTCAGAANDIIVAPGNPAADITNELLAASAAVLIALV